MPKERSHWYLASRAASRLGAGPLADAVLGYGEFVLAGAVSHDSGYYAVGDEAAKAAADRLHGSGGEDSFTPLRALAAQRDGLGAPGLAFGFGALTHLAADAVFHPLVFSWTGDAQAPDPTLRSGWLYRHQLCETALDLHLQSLWGPPPAQTFDALVRKGGRDLILAHSVFSRADSRPWVASHRRLQGLFHLRMVRMAAQVAAWGHRWRDGDQSALFYWGPPFGHPAFEGTLEWVDPVTGAPGRATLEELVARFESLALDLAADWEKAWTDGTEPFAGRIGPALDTGQPCNQDQTKKFFAPKAI